jgi:hypothetical protein
LAILELPLHYWVVDVREDDQVIQVLPHTPQASFFRLGSTTHSRVLLHQVLDPQLLRLDVLYLLLAVLE